jgi:hypothetical protein
MVCVARVAPDVFQLKVSVVVVFGASALERLAGATIGAGERRAVLRFVAALFLLLAAYYVLKAVREPLILASGSATSRSYARAVQAVLLVGVVPLYSALANRVAPARLVQYVFAFFVASLLGFVALGGAGVGIGFAFFVWLGIFSTLGAIAGARSTIPAAGSPCCCAIATCR